MEGCRPSACRRRAAAAVTVAVTAAMAQGNLLWRARGGAQAASRTREARRALDRSLGGGRRGRHETGVAVRHRRPARRRVGHGVPPGRANATVVTGHEEAGGHGVVCRRSVQV
eukprot:scaffold123113_cov75-Phaeocystis_antarctica.AAC.1